MIVEAEALLRHLLDRLEVDGAAPLITSSELADVSESVITAIVGTGLLAPGPAPTAVRCRECDQDHELDVELADAGDIRRAFGVCPTVGRVWLSERELRTGTVSVGVIADAIHQEMKLAGLVRERVRGRAWSIGRGRVGGDLVEIWLFRGLRWPDASATLGSLQLPPNIWAFGTGPGTMPSGIPARLVAEYLTIRGGRLHFDLAQLGAELEVRETDRAPNTFRRDGDSWRVGYQGREPFVLRGLKGAGYLHTLLAEPHTEFTAMVLLGNDVIGLLTATGLHLTDNTTLHELRRRLKEADLDADEYEAIRTHIKSTTRPDGRPASTGSVARKAYGSVKQAIGRTVEAIRRHDADLADHLEQCIDSSSGFVYRPSPAGIRWHV